MKFTHPEFAMTTVFLGGSRHVKQLSEPVLARLRRVVSQRFSIVLGDAAGADAAFQLALQDWGYRQVEVFFTGKAPRHNLDAWSTRSVHSEARAGTAAFYSAKDRVLAEVASVGLMVWDGKSPGTLTNVGRLVGAGKACVVFLQRESRFLDVRTADELEVLAGLAAAEAQLEYRRRLSAELPHETSALL